MSKCFLFYINKISHIAAFVALIILFYRVRYLLNTIFYGCLNREVFIVSVKVNVLQKLALS